MKNVMSAGKTRQKLAKKRSLCVINEQIESNFNAVWPSAIVFQQPAKGLSKIVLLAILVLSILKGTINACPLELPTATLSINGHRLIVELAATPQSRGCGLSKRTALDENQGMLFIYPRSAPRTFWMKDTWLPLSIAFLDDSGNIINIEIMLPDQTEKKYHSSKSALYALEVNQGWFRLHGIKAGDRVEMKAIVNIKGPR
ncbi:DUF192 domain-containing protein [Desulfosarcina sp.]|uniref:DUF192 domain-containing protein n=1 Tax=Desulfosarcina sp. TaxID=2027861 RepID=UPI0029B40ACE|nr:DUF192 domain-containing protein [Desulfosarcina sp.]MDX2454336.1 DUF192 domain-containing protein [Desulfosarcina sp.]